jgi:hypothetical protein
VASKDTHLLLLHTHYLLFKFKLKYTLFSLGMLTYQYERQGIIQIALKRLPWHLGCTKQVTAKHTITNE